MRPLSLAERRLAPSPAISLSKLLSGARPDIRGETDVRLEHYVAEIIQSGFPGFRAARGRALRSHLDSYVRRIIDRDFPELGHEVRNPSMLRRWMAAYAAASSTTASFEKIRDAATSGEGDKPAKTTVGPYRDALERLWILDPVPAWVPTRSRISRLAQPPKHQLADPALAARLLGIDAEALISGQAPAPVVPRDGLLLGALFESLVTQSVRVYAQHAEARVRHLRTKGGAREIDLIVERGDGRVVAIEVKLARVPDDHDVRHLRWLAEQLGDDLLDSVIVTTGRFAYRRKDGIAVVPAALVGP
jgi:predicted AAA+ superfamily ATPase